MKTYLITGATSGIGLETAKQLIADQQHVILVGRDAKKMQDVVSALKRSYPVVKVDTLIADLSSRGQVIELAKKLNDDPRPLHCLINNVGGYFMRETLTCDQVEMTWALNYLNIVLLTHLLLPKLKQQSFSRVVNVSSDAHKWAKHYKATKRYRSVHAYARSKLALVMWSYWLSRKLKPEHVSVNVVHPGLVKTNIGRNNGFLFSLIYGLWFRICGMSPQNGGKTSYHVARADELLGVTGQYFRPFGYATSSKACSYDEHMQATLWQSTLESLGDVAQLSLVEH